MKTENIIAPEDKDDMNRSEVTDAEKMKGVRVHAGLSPHICASGKGDYFRIVCILTDYSKKI